MLQRYIPVVQASVHARHFTKVSRDLTDNNGYFQTRQFRYKVQYSIKWERSYYDIRNGNIAQAWTIQKTNVRNQDWKRDINGGESVMYATMHRAAYKHFYGNNLGIHRPILFYGAKASKTKICYIDKVGTGVFWGDWSASGIIPDIRVWGKIDKNTYKPTQQVFGTTAHELGHQSHSLFMGNVQYWQVAKIIYESWADAVEWALSNDEYHTLGIKYNNIDAINYNHLFNNEFEWPVSGTWEYSPIFIDLIDNINQRTWLGNAYPNDNVTGYTLSYINEEILGTSYGIVSLYNKVKEYKPQGVTDAQIDALFELYW